MQEPLDSIDPFDWNVFGDFLSDRDDPVGEARARRIAQALASGRTGLYLFWGKTTSAMHHNPHRTDYLVLSDPGYHRDYRWLTKREAGNLAEIVSPINPALYPKHFRCRPDVARLFFDKLCDLGPLLWLPKDDTTVSVPASVAVCPECGGELWGKVWDWKRTGEPGTFTVYCPENSKACSAGSIIHLNPSPAWQPVRDAVEWWARDHVRVRVQQPTKEVTA